MTPLIDKLFGGISQGLLVNLALLSLFVFIGSLIAIPIIVVRLPADYFAPDVRGVWMKDHHPILRIAGLLVKNLVGLAFLLAGLAMLILPGQGILTILIGLSLLDFPGKQRLQVRIIKQPTLLNAINSLRSKFSKPPLRV